MRFAIEYKNRGLGFLGGTLAGVLTMAVVASKPRCQGDMGIGSAIACTPELRVIAFLCLSALFSVTLLWIVVPLLTKLKFLNLKNYVLAGLLLTALFVFRTSYMEFSVEFLQSTLALFVESVAIILASWYAAVPEYVPINGDSSY